MSFRCEHCGSVTGRGEKMTRIVTETRPRTYKNPDGSTSRGWEIVRERGVCGVCIEQAVATRPAEAPK